MAGLVGFSSSLPWGGPRQTDESGTLTLQAQAAFADVPRPDIIVVPGGPGRGI